MHIPWLKQRFPGDRQQNAQPFVFLSANTTTVSLNIHRALFVSLFVEPILIIILIRIHQPHHIFFNYLAKPFVLFIIHLNVLFSLFLLFFVSLCVLVYTSLSCSISFDKSSYLSSSINCFCRCLGICLCVCLFLSD